MKPVTALLIALASGALAAGGVLTLGAIPADAAPEKKAAAVFTTGSQPFFEGPRGKVVGSLPPGTPLERTGRRKGARVKVALEGWSRAYQPLRLVADPESLTPRAELVRIPDGRRDVREETRDKYEARWERVRLTGWVPAKGLTRDVSEVWEAARDLQQERCTVCHGFFPPDKLSPSGWRGTLVIMAHRASLTPEEHALLSHYLQSNARSDGGD